jgi:hypothetical protein
MEKKHAIKALTFAGYAALGPITGPCVAGIIRHRKAAPLLAGLYALLLVVAWFDLAMLGPYLLTLQAHLQAMRG